MRLPEWPKGLPADGVVKAVIDPLKIVRRVIADEDAAPIRHREQPLLEVGEDLHRVKCPASNLGMRGVVRSRARLEEHPVERLAAGEVNGAEFRELPFARTGSGGFAIDKDQVLHRS